MSVGRCSGLAVLLLALSAHLAPAQMAEADEMSRPVATGVPAQTAPQIDGRLTEPAWRVAPSISDFVQREPVEGRPASERTDVRVLYDSEALYIGASMFDGNPRGIVVGETRRDASLEDTDALAILLDTYLDRQNAFIFATTPAGIEYDGQVTRQGEGGFGGGGRNRQQAGSGGGFNLNWDGRWEVATTVDSLGWHAEMRIPFSTLRYGSGGPQLWGFNISRQIRRRNEEVYWASIPRQFNLHRVSQAGILKGIEAPSRRVVSVTPYALSSARRDFGVGGDTDMDADVGGDAKLGITSSLALDLTYNTDFAQVEVDEQQVNLDRFTLFFPEKRPFFLENAGTFAVGTPREVEIFFSRRIGIGEDGTADPILGGGRLTGRAGGLTLGMLSIQAEGVDAQGTAPNNYSVGRVMRELPNRTRVGGTFVSRVNTDASDDYNLTYGVDGRLGIGEAIDVDAYYTRTHTPGLDGREHAGSVTASYTTRDWNAGVSFREVGEDFNPEVGFLTRTAYRFFTARLLRHVRLPGVPWLRELRPHVSYRGWFNFDGFNETRNIHVDNHVEFANGAFLSPAFDFTREGLTAPFEIADGVFVAPGSYDNVQAAWRFNTNESAALSFNGGLNVGGLFSGSRKGVFGTLNGRVGTTLASALRFSYDNVDLVEGSFETTLVGLRVAYSFTPRIFLQSLVQYNNQTDNFSSNVRFGWLNTAGTGLFVVFNDLEETAPNWDPLDRAVVIKFTRQFTLSG